MTCLIKLPEAMSTFTEQTARKFLEKTNAAYPKRLIEVDLPIRRISDHARREKSIRHGHISTLHIWWARRPLAACRAVICAVLWPDPADPQCPEAFRQAAREWMGKWSKEYLGKVSPQSYPRFISIQKTPAKLDDNLELRGALLDFIADFANWDNSTVKACLDTSRALTQAAHEALGGAPGTRPLVVDPFAGGGSIPLEALRVGASEVENGTVKNGAATCPVSGFTTPPKSVRRQLAERRGGAADARLLAVVTIKDNKKGRLYRIANERDERAAQHAAKILEDNIEKSKLGSGVRPFQSVPGRDSHRAVASLAVYGIRNFGDLFIGRQTLVILVLMDCIQRVKLEHIDNTHIAQDNGETCQSATWFDVEQTYRLLFQPFELVVPSQPRDRTQYLWETNHCYGMGFCRSKCLRSKFRRLGAYAKIFREGTEQLVASESTDRNCGQSKCDFASTTD